MNIQNTSTRTLSIDILRGLVMIIMALDHTRDFFHLTAMTSDPLDPATTTAPLFFTRWITHFCAPIFVFLSGLSAYLSSRNKTRKQASAFLAKRGLWLIFVEIIFITLALTFNPFYNLIILQVIWAIGCSMLLLSLFIKGSLKLILITGLVIILSHNLLNLLALPPNDPVTVVIKVFVNAFGTFIPVSPNFQIWVLYGILPWTGIMFLGYAIGRWYDKDFPALERKRKLIYSGLAMIGLFIVLRLVNLYGDPSPRKEYGQLLANFFSFLNVSKYPPSLEYTCLTLGPALLFLSCTEALKGWVPRIVAVYGKVPFFYYVLHFYLLHSLLVIFFFAAGNGADQIASFPFFFRPAEFGYSLGIVYLIWILVVVALYAPCKWFVKYKNTHQHWWLRYI